LIPLLEKEAHRLREASVATLTIGIAKTSRRAHRAILTRDDGQTDEHGQTTDNF